MPLTQQRKSGFGKAGLARGGGGTVPPGIAARASYGPPRGLGLRDSGRALFQPASSWKTTFVVKVVASVRRALGRILSLSPGLLVWTLGCRLGDGMGGGRVPSSFLSRPTETSGALGPRGCRRPDPAGSSVYSENTLVQAWEAHPALSKKCLKRAWEAVFKLFLCPLPPGDICLFLRSKMLIYWASLVAQLVKNPPAMQETLVRSQGWEDPLEKGKATHSGILAWRSQRVGHN